MPAYITGLNIVAKTTDGQVTAHIGNDLGVDVNPANYEMIGVKRYYGGESDYEVLDGYTNYIYIDVDGYLSRSIDDYPVISHIRLARVITVDAKISNIIDDRAFLSAMSQSPVPGPHSETHEAGGSDEINVEDLGTDGYKGRVPVSTGSGTLVMRQPLGTRTLIVGADFEYTSLTAALAAAAAMSPSESSPIVILMSPGVYAENNIFGPIEMLDYVHVSIIGANNSTLFVPYNPDGFLFRSSPNGFGSLSGVAIVSCSGVTGGGILIDRGQINLFSQITFVGCSTCSRVTGVSVEAVFEDIKTISCYNSFLIDSYGSTIISNFVTQNMLGTGLSCIGGVAQVGSFTFLATEGVGAKGIVVDYFGQVQLKNGVIVNCNNAVECDNGANLRLDLVRVELSDAYDIFISDAVSVVRSSSSEFSSDKIYNPNNAPILGLFRDTEDNIIKIAGSLDMISGADTWLGTPRMTDAQQSNMIVGWGEEEEGRQWFNTTKNKFVYWNGQSEI